MLLSNCHVKSIFPLALAVEGSALGLIFFRFHSVCCFMMPEKALVFKQMIFLRKKKFGREIERMCRIFFRGFLGPVNDPKTQPWIDFQIWMLKIKFFPILKNLSFLLSFPSFLLFLQSLEKIRFHLHRVGCLVRQISPLIFRY